MSSMSSGRLLADDPIGNVFSYCPRQIRTVAVWTPNLCPEYLLNVQALRPAVLIATPGPPSLELLELAQQLGYVGPRLETTLTPAEREVLHLLATGLSDKCIALRRLTSPRTV